MIRPKLRCDVTGLSRPECGCRNCGAEKTANELSSKRYGKRSKESQ